MKNLLSNKQLILLVLTIFINTILFYFSEKIERSYILKGVELFFSIYIIIIILVGLYVNKRKMSKLEIFSNFTLFLLVNGILIYSLYLFKLFENELTIDFKYSLNLIIGLLSILLLFKIHYDLLRSKNVA